MSICLRISRASVTPSISGIWKSSRATANSLLIYSLQGFLPGRSGHWSHSPVLQLRLEDAAVGGVIVDDKDGTRLEQRRVELLIFGIGKLGSLHHGGEDKGGSRFRLAFHPDGAAHQLSQPLADNQSESGAAIATRGGSVDLLERLKESFDSLRGKSRCRYP